MGKLLAAFALLLIAAPAAGCAKRVASWRQSRRPAALPGATWWSVPSPMPTTMPTTTPPTAPYAFYRGDGRPIPLEAVLQEALCADVIFFGELHEHPEGSRAQKRILDGLLAQPRPLALAMEFFERDTQPAVDAWAAGRLDEEAFRKKTQRPPVYGRTHAPLLAAARAARAPVIAANAPRRLVTAWRKTEGHEYGAWRDALPEAERDLVPRAWSMPKDAYWDRFRALMGDMAEGFFRSQTLWDDAMAEAIADARAAAPDRRVLLVVGGFHVQGRLGTVTKLLQRRPNDRVMLIVMSESAGAGLAFDAEDRGLGDVILKVPPAKRDAPRGANPHEVKPKAPPPSSPPPATHPQP